MGLSESINRCTFCVLTWCTSTVSQPTNVSLQQACSSSVIYRMLRAAARRCPCCCEAAFNVQTTIAFSAQAYVDVAASAVWGNMAVAYVESRPSGDAEFTRQINSSGRLRRTARQQ